MPTMRLQLARAFRIPMSRLLPNPRWCLLLKGDWIPSVNLIDNLLAYLWIFDHTLSMLDSQCSGMCRRHGWKRIYRFHTSATLTELVLVSSRYYPLDSFCRWCKWSYKSGQNTCFSSVLIYFAWSLIVLIVSYSNRQIVKPKPTSTLLHREFGADRVMPVFINEIPDDAPTFAQNGIIVGLRRYRFWSKLTTFNSRARWYIETSSIWCAISE